MNNNLFHKFIQHGRGHCGARLYNERGKSKGGYKDIYTCSSYRKHTTTCTMHFIRTDVVRELILSALRSISEYAKANREAFERLVMDTTSTRQAQQMKESRKALTDRQRRYDELDMLIQRTYEDHVAGKLNEKRFLNALALMNNNLFHKFIQHGRGQLVKAGVAVNQCHKLIRQASLQICVQILLLLVSRA